MACTKSFLVCVFFVGISWILTRKQKQKHNIEFEIENLEPHSVWKLFSNMETLQVLNPTIISYEVISESSKSDRQETGFTEIEVIYSEHLVYFPSITHEAKATYKIYPEFPQIGKHFEIISKHRTEILGTYMDTIEITKFLPKEARGSRTTQILSTVEYDCYLFLTKYCEMEFKAQRALIHANLQSIANLKIGSNFLS